jgi:hypothetical protein
MRFASCSSLAKAQRLARIGWSADSTKVECPKTPNAKKAKTVHTSVQALDANKSTMDVADSVEAPGSSHGQQTMSLEDFEEFREKARQKREIEDARKAAVAQRKAHAEQLLSDTTSFQKTFPEVKFVDLLPLMATRDMMKHYRHKLTGVAYSKCLMTSTWFKASDREQKIPTAEEFVGMLSKLGKTTTVESTPSDSSIALKGQVSEQTMSTLMCWNKADDASVTAAKAEIAGLIPALSVDVRYTACDSHSGTHMLFTSYDSSQFWRVHHATGHISEHTIPNGGNVRGMLWLDC